MSKLSAVGEKATPRAQRAGAALKRRAYNNPDLMALKEASIARTIAIANKAHAQGTIRIIPTVPPSTRDDSAKE